MKTRLLKGELVAIFFQIIYILYSLNGLLYSNGLVANLLMFFSIIFSSYYCFTVNLNSNNKFLRILTIFVGLYIVYYFMGSNQVIYSVKGDPITKTYTLKVVLFAMMSFFPFYYISNKYGYSIHNKKILLFYSIVFVIALAKFIIKKNEHELMGSESGNNASYTLVACLPVAAIFMRKVVFSYIIIGILLLIIIIGMKRGAILVGMMAILIYIYRSLKIGGMIKRNKIINYVVVLLVASVLSIISYKSIISNEALINRFSEISEGGSGRDMIYTALLNKWINPDDATNFLFGYGVNATVRFTGFFAHNDWIEVAITFGLLGVFIYMMMIYMLYKYSKTIEDYIGKTIIMMVMVMWLMSTLFSMFYFHTLTFIYMMLIGIILGNNDRKIRENINC